MSRISVPVCAYILSLYPQSASGSQGQSGGQRLQALANGLAVPSFWSRASITQAFADANSIWIREADIEFSPVNISERSESVPADENGMWIHFVNHLPPRSRGVGVGFVYDLPSHEGGWGGGRVVLVSGLKVRLGLPGFAGSLLAHELGHVLTNSDSHSSDPSNLMYDTRNPRVANAGLLDQSQVALARGRAQSI